VTADVVQQVVFGFSHGVGIEVLASSSDDWHQQRAWREALGRHLRMLPVPGAPVPPDALSHIPLARDRVAILYRWAATKGDGRNNSHALIGTATTLSPTLALELGEWSGWLPEPPSGRLLPLVSVDDLRAQAQHARELLQSQAGCNSDPLRRLLAQLIHDPTAALAVVGWPDDGRLPLLWALHEIGSHYLASIGVQRSWSFSTYEGELAGAPPIALLPVRPARSVDRLVIDVRQDGPPDGPAWATAEQLVALFREGRLDKLEGHATPLTAATDAASQRAVSHPASSARTLDPRNRPPSATSEPGRSDHRSKPRRIEPSERRAQPPAASTSPNLTTEVSHQRRSRNARNKLRSRTHERVRVIAVTVGLGTLLLGLGYSLGFWAATPNEVGPLRPTKQGPTSTREPLQLNVSAVTVNRVAPRPGTVLQMLVRMGSVGPYKVQGPCRSAGEWWTCAPTVPPATLGPSSTVVIVDVDEAAVHKLGNPGTEHLELPTEAIEVARFTVG
jgi:hypothetical protein